MARRAFQAALVAVLAIVLSLWWTKSSPAQPARDLVTGKNNTVLFLTTETHGTCNVHVATAYALAGNHPNVQTHYASFPSLRRRISHISNLAESPRGTAPETSAITFHALSGLPYKAAAITAAPGGLAGLIHRPGAAGAKEMCHTMKHAVTPWTVDDHVAQYDSARRIIDRVDPSLVVVDLVLYPGLAAVRDSRRKHVVLSPNVVSGNVPAVQPGHTMLWKYPM
ncbi:hypothetical protein Micbo1qcDRAFT_178038 [Microdochium bolleyi]|uniref:Uncharacterized protein n=1 Tax=Microdochium bolleyi TaxID=196109 RepID=A0A136IU41_9PEZI|nr:hypothetical protein Micbo1qcDRAFT_178038 [Microdochium bolleyi]